MPPSSAIPDQTTKQHPLKLINVNNELAQNTILENICNDIYALGYSIQENALPEPIAQTLWTQVQQRSLDHFKRAGFGRQQQFQLDENIRSDDICWIQADDPSYAAWLNWITQLQNHLNRRLFLGLKNFESHLAHYKPGAFYQKHLDAFKGQSNRVLSVVAYLNPDWQVNDGGELLLYVGSEKKNSLSVLPNWGSMVVFLSEEFPHEVSPARRDRYSVAGWFRA